MSVRARKNRRCNCGALGVVHFFAPSNHAQQAFAVGSAEVSEPIANAVQVAICFDLLQELCGAEGSGCKNHLTNTDALPTTANPRARLAGFYSKRAVCKIFDVDHGCVCKYHSALALSKIKIVLHEGVLCPVAAPGHALAAVDAAASLRANSAKVWVIDSVCRFAKEDAEWGHLETVAATHSLCNLFQCGI